MSGMNGQDSWANHQPRPTPVNYYFNTVYTPAPVMPPPPDPKPPVIEAKPAPAFDPKDYAAPAAPAAGGGSSSSSSSSSSSGGFTLDTKATGYEDWLSRNRPDGGRNSSSSSSGDGTTPTFGGNGGDRVGYYRAMLERKQPSSAVGHYDDQAGVKAGGNGGQRMAGGRQFKERLNRYRS